MSTSISHLCKQCMGKCCKGIIFITKPEYERLKKVNSALSVIPKGNAYIIDHDQHCPFLGETGCTLRHDQKPVDCVLFPLAFLFQNNKLSFFINEFCPNAADLPQDFVDKNIQDAVKALESWTELEKLEYHKLIVEHSSQNLLRTCDTSRDYITILPYQRIEQICFVPKPADKTLTHSLKTH